MKKMIALSLCILLTLCFFACTNAPQEESTGQTTASAAASDTPIHSTHATSSQTENTQKNRDSVLSKTYAWERSRVRYDHNFDWNTEKIPFHYSTASLLRFTDKETFDTWILDSLISYENPVDYPDVLLSDKNAVEKAQSFSTEEFFAEHALFLICFDVGSGSCHYSDLDVTLDENSALTVSLTITYPNPYTEDMARQIFFVPIQKEYASAENVSLIAETVYLTMEESWDIFKE